MKLTSSSLFNIVLLGIVVFLLLRSCNCGGGKGASRTDTISVRVDTFWRDAKIDTHYVPQPYAVITPGETKTRTLIEYQTITVKDTVKVLGDYFSTYLYADTQNVDYGSVIISDTVTRNRITGRGLKLTQSIPEITKTIVLEKKRSILFFNIGGQYITGHSEIAIGGGLMFKNKQDFALGLNGYVTTEGNKLYNLTVSYPIRLRKK